MLMFFDILALDDGQVLGLKQYERRRLLERVVRRIPGRADLAECQIIRFSSPGAATELRTVFAKCIAARGEGLVIKPADEPYFNFENSRTYRSCCIKLKKEAFGAFGDVGDFAIVGAAYDSVRAKTYKIPSLQWTDFYIGCLENKDGVSKANVKPRFVVVTTVSLSQQILEALVHTLHIMSLPYGNNDHFDLRLENGINQGRKPSVIFSTPPVVDLRCFAFDKEGNTGFWTMRFPAVTKLHADRTFMDTISFVELQQMAETHRTMPEDEAAEELRWIRLLEAADLRGVAVDASTQYTSSSAPTTPTLGGRLLENSGQHQAFLIREDAAEKQQQVADRDAPIADPPPLTGDHFPSSSDSVGSPVMIERRSASLNSSTIENMGQSSKRTRDARSESPVQHQKRQRVSKSMKSSSYLAIEIHPVTPPTLSRPLSNITNSSLKPCTSPKLGKWLSTIQKNTSEAATNQCKELLTKTKNSPANGSPYPTPYDIDGSSSALRGNQAIGESAPIPRPSNLLETSVRRNPKVVADTWKGNSICQQASASCLFVNCSFLLAPCVGGMPLLTEDLLPSHGARFILDPSLWLDSDAFPRRCSFSRHKTRKLVLVEPRRIQETVKMFKAIQNLNLVRGDGRREWVEVYDFRIVECVSKMEMDAKARYNLWRHFWIGAA
jgi:DNA ligase-4